MSKAKELMDELGEAKELTDLVLDHYKTTLFNIGSIADDRVKKYLPQKLERRIRSDYAGKKDKLQAIYKKITALDKAFKSALDEIQKEVG